MLHFKPRTKPGTNVSSWKAINETKNRGPMLGAEGAIFLSDYNLAGVANTTAQGYVNMMNFQGSSGGWMTFTRLLYSLPLTIELRYEFIYDRGNPADGLIINLSQYNGNTIYTGGVGGNIGFVTSTPTIGFTLDNWPNSGQPVPQFTVKDSRSGDAFRYTSPWVGLSWDDVTGKDTLKVQIYSWGVVASVNGTERYSAQWTDIDGGRGLPPTPWIITLSNGTGASTQMLNIHWMKVNGAYWFYNTTG